MGDFEPFGHSASSTFRSVEGWTSDQNSNFDYGAIILKSEDLYNRINATMGFMPSANEAIVEIAGYPDDKIARMPYTASGPIHSRSKFRFFYDVDTEGGNSGSPVFIKDAAGIYAVGIHTDGDNPDNYGIRFRQEMMDRLNEWMQL
jgi:V8-like Glu-specific endopeptidase